MSNGVLFICGFFITALVLFAVGGLVYAARLDGLYHQEMEAKERDSQDEEV